MQGARRRSRRSGSGPSSPTRSCATRVSPPRWPARRSLRRRIPALRTLASGARRLRALTIVPVHGVPEIRPGDIVATLVADAADAQGTPIESGDCLVVTQKVVSKAENRLVELDPDDRDARRRLVESESVRILRRRGDLVIAETRHGFVCANAGVDLSNVEDG